MKKWMMRLAAACVISMGAAAVSVQPAVQAEAVQKQGWKLEKDVWYYYKNGQTVKGWFLDKDNKWYYLDLKTGAMKTGWLQDGGKWYYLNRSGAMVTGWLLEHDKWYYLNRSGAMVTGWLQDGGSWYYLNGGGVMQTGWQQIDGKRYYFNRSGAWVPNTVADDMPTIQQYGQLILVTASGYSTSTARIRTFEKRDGKWTAMADFGGYIGKYGFAVEMKEGAARSPRGTYTIGTAFGRYDNPGTKLPYRKTTTDDVWVDDPNSALYNTWQLASQNNGRWKSAEKMYVPAYNYGFVINYNTAERVPGKGSAIFFHVASSYTLGCTGTAEKHVLSVLRWLDPAKKPVIVQTPDSELNQY